MQANVRIGPAGWSYDDWNGIVYPQKRPPRFDALEYLSSYFSLIEINSTFYRIPTAATCRRWAERTPAPPRFAFSVKANQDFTHSTRAGHLDEVDAFKRAVTPLADTGKLAAILVQYPWSFRDAPEARRRLEDLAGRLAPFPVALEVRHGSWARPEAVSFLESTGHTVCGIDQPVIGDSIAPHRHIPGAAGSYFRFHGRNYADWFRGGAGRDARYDYSYSTEELRSWVETITQATAGGAVSVVMNNHFRGQAVANAFELIALLGPGRPVAPAPLRRAYPRLREVTSPDPEADATTGWLFEG
jgi:uncharacterized protein YecE (DUF72 family)